MTHAPDDPDLTPASPDRWSRIHAVFEAVHQAEPAERDALLETLCEGDEVLRAEVESLLRHEAAADARAFLAMPTMSLPSEDPVDEFRPGHRIGPYEIRSRLGQGGMGAVYLAARVEDYEKLVAIKVIRPGIGATSLQRFHAERQLLARLEHPHIVRLLDGGTTAGGQPFLVMEYVNGMVLDRYCDTTNQSVRQRTQLLLQITRAVEYAHKQRILHRDLKPSNVMVDQDGDPKVADFGLARSIQQDSTLTGDGQAIGTPSYMSPEQARGTDLNDPRIDVYGLGAILYALLTGRPPFRGETPIDVIRQVTDDEPIPPHRLLPGLSRDLNTICLHCLEKDANRRYPTASALAEDLDRYLADRPILARPVSAPEKMWRWCKRNPRLTVSLTALVVAIVAGFSGVTYMGSIARAERATAESNLVRVISTLDGYTKLAQNPALNQPQLSKLRRDLLVNAMEEFQRLGRELGDNPRLDLPIIQAMLRAGELTILTGQPGPGLSAIRDAVSKAERALARRPADPEIRYALVGALHQAARFESSPEGARAAMQRADEVTEALITENQSDPRQLRALQATNAYNVALHIADATHSAEALEFFERSRDLCEAQVTEADADLLILSALGRTCSYIAESRANQNQMDLADAAYRRSNEVLRQVYERRPNVVAALTDYCTSTEQLQNFSNKIHRADEATRYAELNCKILRAALDQPGRPSHVVLDLRRRQMNADYMLQLQYASNESSLPEGDPRRSEILAALAKSATQTIELADGLRPVLPNDPQVEYWEAVACYHLAGTMFKQNLPATKSLEILDKGISLMEQSLQQRDNPTLRSELDEMRKLRTEIHPD
jgi:serine/threonine protein kinase